MKIIMKHGRTSYEWNNGEIIVTPKYFQYMKNVIKNNVCILDDDMKSDLMYVTPDLDTPEGFVATIYRCSHGMAELEEAPKTFKEWYSIKRKPYRVMLPDGFLSGEFKDEDYNYPDEEYEDG